MGSKRKSAKDRWNLETMKRRRRGLLVICPKCNKLGTLYFHKKIGWYVKHGSRESHSINKYDSLTVPLHSPKLALVHYMGGDYFLIPLIAQMVPPHKTYVEVFGGGAPFLLNKPPSEVEVYNDIEGDLVNLFTVVRDHYDEFMKLCEWLLYSRKMHYDFLSKYKEEKDPVRRAFMYFYVLRTSFSGIIGAGFSTGVNPDGYITSKFWGSIENLKMIHERLKYVIIEQLDFRECIKRYDREYTFFYLDPPHLYYSTEKGKDYYAEGFTEEDYTDLLNLLLNVKGKWLLKQNYLPFVVDWAKEHGFHIFTVKRAKFSSKSIGKGTRTFMRVVFIANYNLKNPKS